MAVGTSVRTTIAAPCTPTISTDTPESIGPSSLNASNSLMPTATRPHGKSGDTATPTDPTAARAFSAPIHSAKDSRHPGGRKNATPEWRFGKPSKCKGQQDRYRKHSDGEHRHSDQWSMLKKRCCNRCDDRRDAYKSKDSTRRKEYLKHHHSKANE